MNKEYNEYTPRKDRTIYLIFALFFGMFGIHNFYSGYTTQGLVQLLLTVLFGWLILPLFAVFIWVIVDMCTVTKDATGRLMV